MLRPRPIAIDLYAGAGGMSCGFEQAGFDIVLAVDNDPHHTATHARNFPYGVSHTASVAELSAADLRRLAGLGMADEVDLLFGGPPCQGFSHMGLRDSDDPRNSLVAHFVRIVDELRPRAFVMENVTGMNTGATAAIFAHAVAGLQAAGYLLTLPVQALNAVDYGVPQARRRLFLLGLRADLGRAAAYPPALDPAHRPTVAAAFEDLPEVDADPRFFHEDRGEHRGTPAADNVYARYARGLPTDLPDHARRRSAPAGLSGCIRVRHSAAAVSLYAATRPGTMVPGHKLPRLDPAGVSPTLRAGTNSERGSHTAPRPVHPVYPRVITIREAARLHGYPDWFSFYPAKWHAYRQIGNSVCPPVARAVGLEIMRALGVDPAALPRPVVTLADAFVVGEAHAPRPRRIQTAEEFPKVVQALWSRAFVDGALGAPEVTLADIEAAYALSAANLPRVRPARFVAALLRYRKADLLLHAPRAQGYTLVAAGEGGQGRWAPLAERAASPARPAPVRTGALNEAQPLTLVGWRPTATALAALAAQPQLRSALGWATAPLAPTTSSAPSPHPVLHIRDAPVVIFALEHARLPPLVKLGAAAAQAGCAEALLLAAITDQHVLAARFDCRGPQPVERGRAVFLVGAGAAPVG
ncbi:MAG: DNA cytosine methyltransferase [Deltaproteobacteria bacterium]|nr:DNA cytosine methyltransferase [Deltaproteobacteria bacterium]